MTKEAVNKLSQLIRDKDLEITALKSRNESLVALVKRQEGDAQPQTSGEHQDHHQNSSSEDGQQHLQHLKAQVASLGNEKQQLYEALTQKHQESLAYYKEIERLNQILVQQQQQQQASASSSEALGGCSEKSVIDNSNQIIVLKAKIQELEKKLAKQEMVAIVGVHGRRRFHSERVDAFDRGEENEEKSEEETNMLKVKLQEATSKVDAKDKVRALFIVVLYVRKYYSSYYRYVHSTVVGTTVDSCGRDGSNRDLLSDHPR